MRLIVRGIVQGVGFRPTVHRIATSMGLRGFVRNNGTNVVIEVEGDGQALLSRLMEQLPPLARIEGVEIEDGPLTESVDGFVIKESEGGEGGIGIPNDVAICEACLDELFSPGNRRYLYPFINCTDCGARFTLIRELPYDRRNTSMGAFPMCEHCREEYLDPGNRRFHHQTISCPECGPSYRLLDQSGERIDGDPIGGFAARIEEGEIGVAKSWGGMHLICSLTTLPKLRELYGRREKPFAIMVRDVDAAERYGSLTEHEEAVISSSHRPVTIVRKRFDDHDGVSPGLSNVGIMLPYTAMHHLLFHHLDESALIMTSANAPGEPMILDHTVTRLRADCYLLHNREIVNRCDDSVVRVFGGRTNFIRRSRGHVPSPIPVGLEGEAIGIGAQENLTGCLGIRGGLYLTQYIGDGGSPGVLDFLEESLRYYMRLLGVREASVVGIDLHPGYSNRHLARRLADELGAEIMRIQHHWAHAASLMVDAGLSEMVALTLDGTGYGADGTIWGGEVLRCDLEGYHRAGHLEALPLLGGEAAVRDPRRLLFGIEEVLGTESALFPSDEAEVLRRMLPASPVTSSFGRVLDALSCHFGVCCSRTYDGEPAMKLEPLLERGGRLHDFEVERTGGVVRTLPMFDRLLHLEGRAEDLAYSFVHDLLLAMVELACEVAEAEGIRQVGLTGGVAYNQTISSIVEEAVASQGLRFVGHDRVPNGDGGISVGQCAIALRSG